MTSTDSVVIYGASDDLIEVEGTIREEFSDPQFADQGAYVYVSTGDVLAFSLEEEGWRAAVVVDATSPTVGKRPVDDPDFEDDEVTIAGPVAWVVATTVTPARAR